MCVCVCVYIYIYILSMSSGTLNDSQYIQQLEQKYVLRGKEFGRAFLLCVTIQDPNLNEAL